MDVDERNRLAITILPWCQALVTRHVPNRQDREDALQVVLLRVLRGLPSYRPERGALTTWVAAVSIRVLHRPTRRKELQLVQLPVGLVDVRQRKADDQLDDGEQRARVREVMARLDDADREMLRRHVLDGVPLAACDRSVSRERVRQRYARVCRLARELMATSSLFPPSPNPHDGA